MRWTSEKPSKPGWYWWRNMQSDPPEPPQPVEIYWVNHLVYGPMLHVSRFEGEWAGPIELPVCQP